MRTPVVPSVQIFESKDPDFYSGFTLIKTETLCVVGFATTCTMY